MGDASLSRKTVDLRRITLLLVDENEQSRSFTRSICRSMHFDDILIAGSSSDALDVLRTKKVGLVLCDSELSPMSAIDFVKKIRSNEAGWLTPSIVPIILLTSEGSPAAFIDARDAGVSDFLVRPLVMQRLMNSVNSIFLSQRPYVKSKNYIGPCRRRKQAPFHGPERRAGFPEKPASLEPAKPAEKKPVVEEPVLHAADTMRLDDIQELFELVRQMKEPDSPMKEIIDRIFQKAHDVKLLGDTYGFPLLNKVGELLCGFIRGADPESFRTLSRLQAVETHAIVMKMIVDSNMHDEGDELAMEVMDELQTMVNKFKV